MHVYVHSDGRIAHPISFALCGKILSGEGIEGKIMWGVKMGWDGEFGLCEVLGNLSIGYLESIC